MKTFTNVVDPFMDFEEEPQSKIESEGLSVSLVPVQGHFRRAIPCMPIGYAVLLCLINFVIPGLGTFFSSFFVIFYSEPRYGTRLGAFCTNILAAVMQFLSAPVLIGYVWSAIWGVLFVQIARKWFISSIDNRFSSVDMCPCSRW